MGIKQREKEQKLREQEQQKLQKQKKNVEAKARKDEMRPAKLQKEEQENLVPQDGECSLQKEFEKSEDDCILATESKPLISAIKRGIPQNTKPPPAVVAVKMADLLSSPNGENNSKENDTGDIGESEVMDQNVNSLKKEKHKEKQRQEEKNRLEKEIKQQEKLKKAEEADAKKEKERLAKLEKQERE